MIFVTSFCLMIVISHCISGKVITINNNGDDSDLCCRDGLCECSSLYNAATLMGNNTVISITSQTVVLDDYLTMNYLNNITITGNGAIMCNHTGSVTCSMCSNVAIEGITWDQCGDGYIGISFYESASNISIINCTFQRFRGCIAVEILGLVGILNVINSKFVYNLIDVTYCDNFRYSSLLIWSNESATVNVYDSLFYNNGNPYQDYNVDISGTLSYFGSPPAMSILVKDTSFFSNGIGSVYIYSTSPQLNITFDGVNVFNNRLGAHIFFGGGVVGENLLIIISSYFIGNGDRTSALNASYFGNVYLELFNTTFANNQLQGTYGTALKVIAGNGSTIIITLCAFYNNTGGDSVIYINSYAEIPFPFIFNTVLIHSSNFINNKIGSVLKFAKCFLKFYAATLFQDNSAKSGAALYIAESSQISVDDGSTVQFINNTASLRGGAMYIDLTNCYDHGIVFTNFTENGHISFINNSAELSGNSIYFDIPNSCDVIRDYTNNGSAAYVPYKFNFTQSHDIHKLPIIASPYEIKLCSTSNCNFTNSTNYLNNYTIEDDIMLGQSVYFSSALYDYFNAVAEPTNFQVICTNCGSKFRVLNNQLLVQNGSRNQIKMISIDSNADVENDTNIILNISSLLSPEYRELTATLSLTLSSCNNGFLFTEQSQQCECYNKDDYLQCDEDSASIKLGYWFGLFHEQHTLSVCHDDYCNFFTSRKEMRGKFYNLPEETDDQCNSHRTGVACGQCSEGYTLSYNSPDCISVEKCSPRMTVLVIILTFLYWIVMIAMLFGVTYYFNTQQISPGYLYDIIFFYSIVYILLVTNLHLTDAVFYTATIFSSFAKLNPQFLGRLCFIANLDAIDQQFIHCCHVVFISIILIVIYIMAKCNNRILLYVSRGMVQVTCFLLLFSYTSVTSASLLLLRAIKFDDIDGLYTYLSPHLKYFADRHAAYASMAILCLLLVTIGLPLLLVMEPLLVKVFNYEFNKNAWKKAKLQIESITEKRIWLVRIKQLLDQLQDCYKDQHRWFAAYYLICRLVIMLITYYANNDYDYMVYYLQTACVVITMTHIWIQPHKDDLFNKLDTVILLIMLLVVNLSAFNYFSTSAIEGVAITLIFAPLLLLFGFTVRKYLVAMIKKNQISVDGGSNLYSSSTPK